MQQPNIAPGHVDLWYTHIDRTDAPGLRDQYRELLRGEERDRAARLKLPRVRDEYLVTRALVRHVLSHYADVPPGAWAFVQNAHGKPIVSAPWPGFAAFNLSHSAGLVACAVAAVGQMGVDVESLQRKTTGIDLARRFFSAAEVSLLEACPSHRQHETFLQIWTLKEAYIKAIGHGLSFPLDKFSMSLPADGPPRIQFAPDHNLAPEEMPCDWRFAQIRFHTHHHLSLAVSFPQSQELVVNAREVVPLADDLPRTASLAGETDQATLAEPFLCDRANHWFAHQA
jgi:4'-phosphopantetheinyl transferase